MDDSKQAFYFVSSIFFHCLILAILIFGFEFSARIPVIQNTNKMDVISAVVLGDSPQSKILPQPVKEVPKQETKPMQKVEPTPPKEIPVKPDVIALQKAEKQKQALLKALEEKKRREALAKDLLADISKEKVKQKNVQTKKLRNHFEKTLKEHTEKSLREQLLEDDILLSAKQKRETQGIVDKYQALIVQAISHHWLVPPSADKKLYCQLMIRVEPDGQVLDVQIIKTSGDKALDSSARAAVLKASPLPVPKDKEAFNSFKKFVLKVKPENVIRNDTILGSE